MVDDVTVAFTPCGGSSPPPQATTTPGAGPPPPPGTEPPPPPPPSTDGIAKICCDFNSGPCGYSKGGGPKNAKGDVKDFEKAGPERYHNPATGVPPSPDKKCWASYIKQKESSYMETDCEVLQDIIIKFQEYKATQDLSLKCCCDSDAACTYDTGGKVEKGDFRQWYQGSVQCPSGTKKVVFVCENTGPNEGGCGVDNIEVYDTSGNQICGGGGGGGGGGKSKEGGGKSKEGGGKSKEHRSKNQKKKNN